MLQLRDLRTRIDRLEALMRGLAPEVSLWREANDPLLYRERRAYLQGIQDALAGVETARGVMGGRPGDVSNAIDRPATAPGEHERPADQAEPD